MKLSRTPLKAPLSVVLTLSATLLALPLTLQAQQAPFINTLMPQPQELRLAGDPIAISPALTISLHGTRNPLLQAAAQRMLDRLESQTGVQLGKAPQNTDSATIDVRVQNDAGTRPTLETDESYTLDVQDGRALLKAPTIFGAMHGFETLLQLIQPQASAFVLPAVHIVDAPRFPWRGLMLDPGRRFLPVGEVLRTLDGMAAVKMNVLHWHLTEDQGFRIESLRFPRLHQLGSDGLYYTQQQVREIVQYAAARGIRVVPEFDMPGHATSWFVGYPELGSRPGPYSVEHENHIVNAAFDPTRESTFRFLDAFLTEMAGLFPDEYIHIGGDESNGKDWKANPAIVRFMQQHSLSDTNALQAYFNTRVQALLRKHNRQMVGWDEILQPNLGKDVIIQSWRGTQFLVNGAREGHRGILSQPYYLDHMRSAAEMYAADPIPAGTNLSAAEAKLVLGGEACMWGEQIAELTADSRIWPRTAVIAERLWSPATVRDTDAMYRRLAVTSLRLDALGLTHLSAPQRGLRQLAGSDDGAQQLAIFTSVLQPVDFHERAAEQHTSPLTPIGRLVDFTTPDPPAKHAMQALVQSYLQPRDAAAHQAQAEQLQRTFRSWIEVSPELEKLAAANPLIAEVKERREELPLLGMLGLQAVGYIEAHQAPPTDWLFKQQALLKQAGEHKELVDFVQLDSLTILVEAATREHEAHQATQPNREGANLE